MTAQLEIAAAAARLVVEEGMEYGAAKRRAARDMRLQRASMPSNELVEAEVRDYLALFCAETQPTELRALREVALSWMKRLVEFRPYLAGAVWRGTATRLSAVLLELYCDDSKSAELAMVNLGVDYDVGAITQRGGEDLSVLTVASRCVVLGETITVHMTIHDHDDLRGALKPDASGRPWRGDMAAVVRVLAADAREIDL